MRTRLHTLPKHCTRTQFAALWMLTGSLLLVGVAPGFVLAQQATQARAVLSASSSPATAKSDDPALLSRLASIHVQSPLVQTPVTVMDRSGEFVQDLSKSDFRILDNGVPQRITRFGLATQPVAAVIVIQTNEAVAPLLNQVRPTGPIFSNLLLGHRGRAAVICFDNTSRVVQSFTSDPDALDRALEHIGSHGTRARLNDALARAILMLAEQPTTYRRVIVTFAEGFDRGSETSRAEIIRAATGAGIAIYGMRFRPGEALFRNQQTASGPTTLSDNMALPGTPGSANTPGRLNSLYNTPVSGLPLLSKAGNAAAALKGKNLLQIYADYTGGKEYSHWKGSREVQKQLMRVALEVNSQYMLAYVPSTLNQVGFHRLQVEVLQPNLRVRARAGYFNKMKTK